MAKNSKKPKNDEELSTIESAEIENNIAESKSIEPKENELNPLPDGMVYVKILKHVGMHSPGEIVAVDAKSAEAMCKSSVVNDGQIQTTSRKAMLLSESQHLESLPLDIKKLTAKDMADLGKKNIVITPKDASYEKQLANLKKGKSDEIDPSKSYVSEKVMQDDSEGADADFVDRKKAPIPK